jgi:hypothetical protein
MIEERHHLLKSQEGRLKRFRNLICRLLRISSFLCRFFQYFKLIKIGMNDLVKK